MSLAASEQIYLDQAFAFLKSYQWIFNYKNTDIYTRNVLSTFPDRWIHYLSSLSNKDFHSLLKGDVKGQVPDDLKKLLDEIGELSVQGETAPVTELSSIKIRGVSEKKCHEIALLAPLIHQTCQEAGSDLIIDIGCGVGHLSQLLNTKYNYDVIGLEVSKKLIETARAQQTRVLFEEMCVDDNSSDNIQKLINAKTKICLTGLHACADLSVNILKLFVQSPWTNAMVIMPCCYHRMTSDQNDEGTFVNFPCSSLGNQLFIKYEARSFLRQPFLRLACQQTVGSFVKMSYEEHIGHARLCMQRAILEKVAREENCTVRRLKRKSGKSDINGTDTASGADVGFQRYLNNLPATHELCYDGKNGPRIDDDSFRTKMLDEWTERRDDCRPMAVLMGLQAAIQALCENVILLDRVLLLRENGLHCYRRRVTNDCVSPRCWALIAKKEASLTPINHI